MVLELGTQVIFDSKVYKEHYTPYYDKYKGHYFEVVDYLVDENEVIIDHVYLRCLTDENIKVDGCVHEKDLIVI